MTHQPNVQKPSTSTRSFKLFLHLIIAGLLAAPGVSHANQVHKACGKKWVKKAKALSPEQLTWMLAESTANMTEDLDGDGTADTLTVKSRATYRNCDLKDTWSKKETSVRIEYGDGKSKLFFWTNDGLVKSLKFYPGLTRFLVVGVDARGETTNRWVEAGRAPGPAPRRLLADRESPKDAASAEAFKISSIQ